MATASPPPSRRAPQPRRETIRHPNGQSTAFFYDSFADPWKPAETILIQHGFCRTAHHFYHWVPALARKYNVVRRELRGHGGSSIPGEGDGYDYSTATIIDEIRDTLDQLGVQRVHFLGESTSGMLAEIFAATYPDRVASVIVCSSPTHLPEAAQRFLAFGLPSWPEACRRLGSREWVERLAASPGTLASEDPAYKRWWVDRVAESEGEGLAGYAEFLGRLDSRPYLGDIKAPMLILAPTNSAVVTVESMEDLKARVALAQLQLIPSPGHEIYAEQAEQCQVAVLAFLEGLQKPE
ncbi:alpha/beta-hydrolase [Coniochaeta ligniaria NRRL 30616]|uniref:Alpha/beta-hydrolase n=1 Tax=Coniochaeta ligniaria NRRL 30616 TaxID=1408157 RepID=A0A1J7J633_9PEZI|nr:alpha/beta-hydrolase [Coniochaeta ligniaria NRRL 30616]